MLQTECPAVNASILTFRKVSGDQPEGRSPDSNGSTRTLLFTAVCSAYSEQPHKKKKGVKYNFIVELHSTH